MSYILDQRSSKAFMTSETVQRSKQMSLFCIHVLSNNTHGVTCVSQRPVVLVLAAVAPFIQMQVKVASDWQANKQNRMNTNSGLTHPAAQKQLHFELWHLQERGSPGECCCGCRQGPALCVAPWGPPAPPVSASVAAVSYSTARDSPATVEDWRDGNNMVRKH